MPSPFPGMNPYLEHEDAWHNFHEQFPGAVVAVLEPQVGPNYFVRIDERIYVHEVPNEPRRFLGLPDVAISERTSTDAEESAPAAGATAVSARHVRVFLPAIETVGHSYVEIRDRRDRRL